MLTDDLSVTIKPTAAADPFLAQFHQRDIGRRYLRRFHIKLNDTHGVSQITFAAAMLIYPAVRHQAIRRHLGTPPAKDHLEPPGWKPCGSLFPRDQGFTPAASVSGEPGP
jgi:hypothetical protein